MKKVRNVIFVLLSVLFAMAMVVACSPEAAKPVTITLDKTELTMEIDEEKQLVATIENSDKAATFSSDKAAIATVSATGLVKAISNGTATITATVADKSATCVVTVREGKIKIVNRAQVDMGKTITLTSQIENITGAVTWRSKDTTVATIDATTGVVTPVKAGKVTMVAKVSSIEEECDIEVLDRFGWISIGSKEEFIQNISANLNGNYYLTNNIDFEGSNVDCIGYIDGGHSTPFNGILDGNGFNISNMNIGYTSVNPGAVGAMWNIGIFREIGETGVIRNLNIVDATLTAESHAGVFGDKNAGLIENCFVDVTATLNAGEWGARMGGFISENAGEIKNCMIDITGAISQTGTQKLATGAVAAVNSGKIIDVYAKTEIAGFSKIAGDGNGEATNATIVTDLKTVDLSDWGMWSVKDDATAPTIKEQTIPVASMVLKIDGSNSTIEDGYAGSNFKVVCYSYPTDAAITFSLPADAKVALKPEDFVATISSKAGASVTANASYDLTAKITVDAKEFSTKIAVNVVPAKYVVEIGANDDKIALGADETDIVLASAKLKGVVDTAAGFTYESNNTAVATVNATTGVVTAVKAGIAEITVKAKGAGDLASRETRVSAICNVVVNGNVYNSNFTAEAIDTQPIGWSLEHIHAAYKSSSFKVAEIGETAPKQKIAKFDSGSLYNYAMLAPDNALIGVAADYYMDYEFTKFQSVANVENWKESHMELLFAGKDRNPKDSLAVYIRQMDGLVKIGASNDKFGDAKKIGAFGTLSPDKTYRVRVAVTDGKVYVYISENGAMFKQVGSAQDIAEGYIYSSFGFFVSSGIVQFNKIEYNYGEQNIVMGISNSTLDVNVGVDKTLTAFFPYESEITFVSETPAYVTVDEKTGVVSAIKKTEDSGDNKTITITASTTYKTVKYSATCEVTAFQKPLAYINEGYAEIAVGGTKQFTSQVKFPLTDTDADKKVTWTSSKPAIATVDQTGLVTAVASGITTIKVTINGAVFEDTQDVCVTGVVLNQNLKGLTALPTGWVFNGTTWSHTILHSVNEKGFNILGDKVFGNSTTFIPVNHAGVQNFVAEMQFTNFETKNTAGSNIGMAFRFAEGEYKQGERGGSRRLIFNVPQGAGDGVNLPTCTIGTAGDAQNTTHKLAGFTENLDKTHTYRMRVAAINDTFYFYLGVVTTTENVETCELKLLNPGGTKLPIGDFPVCGLGIETSSTAGTIEYVKMTYGKQTSEIFLSDKEVSLDYMASAEVSAVLNESQKGKNIIWTSSDEDIATVTANAKDSFKATIKAVENGKEGVATITAKVEGSTETTLTKTIKVTTKFIPHVKIMDGDVILSMLTMLKTDTVGKTLTAKVAYGINDPIAVTTTKWATSDDKIVTIDDKGKVLPVVGASGTVEITATVTLSATDKTEYVSKITVYLTDANSLVYTTPLTNLTALPTGWEGNQKDELVTGNKFTGTTTATVPGILVDATGYSNNACGYGPEIGENIPAYYMDYTFTGFGCYNNDPTRFIGFKFAFDGSGSIARDYYRFGMRQNGKDFFFSKVVNAVEAAVKYTDATPTAFDPEKTFVARIALVRVGDVYQVRTYIGNVGENSEVTFNMIKFGGKSFQTIDAVKYNISRISIIASSAKVTVTDVKVYLGIPTEEITASIAEATTGIAVSLGDNSKKLTTVFSYDGYERVKYVVADPTVATVDINGAITPLKNGSTTVVAKVLYFGKTYTTAPCTITVETKNVITVPDAEKEIELDIAGTKQITPTVLYGGQPVVDPAITWSSSNTAIATVNNGLITAVKAGKVTITATPTTDAGNSETIVVTVGGLAYQYNFAEMPVSNTLPEGWTKHETGGSVTIVEDGMKIVGTVGGQYKVWGPQLDSNIKNFYIDYTFTDFSTNADGKYGCFKYMSKDGNVDNWCAQIGQRVNGMNDFFGTYTGTVASRMDDGNPVYGGTYKAVPYVAANTYKLRVIVTTNADGDYEVNAFVGLATENVSTYRQLDLNGRNPNSTSPAVDDNRTAKFKTAAKALNTVQVGFEVSVAKIIFKDISVNYGIVPTV